MDIYGGLAANLSIQRYILRVDARSDYDASCLQMVDAWQRNQLGFLQKRLLIGGHTGCIFLRRAEDLFNQRAEMFRTNILHNHNIEQMIIYLGARDSQL